MRVSFLALLSSRALIWAAGIVTALAAGLHKLEANSFNHHHLVTPFQGVLGDLLVAPAARWDSVWYIGIAHFGYHRADSTVFFPLYPLLAGAGGLLFGGSVGADLIVGIFVSLAAAVAALFLVHRLTALEFGRKVADNAVWIYAWLPVAFFLSAVYSEALFLALAVGSFYSARTGRWWAAGLLGALAAAARNSGILLVVPLLLLYLYGPRTDRPATAQVRRWWPRHRVRPDILWIALVPVGLIAYLVYLKLSFGHGLLPFTEEKHWHRSLDPLGGIPAGIWLGLKSIVAFVPALPPVAKLGDFRKVVEIGFLALSGWLLWRCWKRLPLAYTAYAAVGLALAASVPTPGEPLRSLPRFTLVIFPLWIALGLWATERRRVSMVLAACAPLVVLWTALFTSWTWAA